MLPTAADGLDAVFQQPIQVETGAFAQVIPVALQPIVGLLAPQVAQVALVGSFGIELAGGFESEQRVVAVDGVQAHVAVAFAL